MFVHGGWGKVDSAASVQWAIMEFHPRRIVNLGTAGGFPGRIKEGDIVFVTKTVIYDIVDRMGDNEESIQEYTTVINTEIPPQLTAYVIPSAILSADQDIDPERLPTLMKKYDAVAGDWESGSIARVCQRNGVQLYFPSASLI